MRKALAVGRKEFRQIVRDKRTLMILLFVPVFFLLLFGYALNWDIRHVRLAVDDRDHTPESRSIVSAFVNSGYFDLVSSVDPSALPASFRVAPTQVRQTTQLRDKYNTRPGVDEAITADKAIKQLIDITTFLRYMFIAISTILIASSLFLIVNTIRLATFARRREIEVMKLVGASNWFVRIPFMAEGLVQGAVGAGLAVSGVFALQYLLSQLDTTKGFFQGFFVTTGNAGTISIGLLVVGAVIGAVGAGVGLRRFLNV